ncbi:MAG: RNase adapter RapZ [Gammaproteobacteria bacterium]
MKNESRRLIVVSGSSGAGKSVVLHALEDLDYYCIDNLPVSLLKQIPDHVNNSEGHKEQKIAVGIDARSTLGESAALENNFQALRETKLQVQIVFLDADDDVLTKRFSETRRKHPLSSAKLPLAGAIEKERKILGAISELADVHIDTSFTTLHDLREITRERIARDDLHKLSVQLVSFGFKHGSPRDTDFIFDVRCLPNPHWHKNLRQLSGLDAPVTEFLNQQPTVKDMITDIAAFLNKWIKLFAEENRSYLTIGIGCTGGQHRSVYVVEKLAGMITNSKIQSLTTHRDL